VNRPGMQLITNLQN